jgi:acyl-CoA reductase-like NAD-dependent aldehyde dehydrogenase
MTWKTDEEVIARSNNTKMGLGASVWSSDIPRANRIAEQLEAGSVWVNAHFQPSPYGALAGHKESGIGSEGGLSGMRGYCNVTTLYLKKARL